MLFYKFDTISKKLDRSWLTTLIALIAGQKKKLYLSAILDLYDRSIVSYVLSNRNNNQLVFDTFNKAIEENPGAHPIFHSDRGFQYTSKTFKMKLDENGMIQSMSRVGKCIDNGPMEGFWGILKSEMFYGIYFDDEQALKNKIEEYIFNYINWRLQKNWAQHLINIGIMPKFQQILFNYFLKSTVYLTRLSSCSMAFFVL